MNIPVSARAPALLFGLAATLASVSSPARAATPDLQVHAGASDAVKAWQRAMQAGDIAAITRMHGKDTLVYGVDTMVTTGDAAIMQGYDAMFARYTAQVDIRDAGWVRQGPLLASWGRFTLTLTPRDGGAPVTLDGRFSDVAAWKADHWQYVMDHASVPAR